MLLEKIKTLVIDDEINAIEGLTCLLNINCKECEIVGKAKNIEEAKLLIDNLNPDLIFLDIEMPFGNGFELLSKFNNPKFKVVFVTGFDKYGVNAIKFNAMDYLLKPVQKDELIMAINKVKSYLSMENENLELKNLLSVIKNPNSTNNKIVLKTTTHTYFVEVGTILYFESLGQYTKVILQDNKTYMVSNNIGEFEHMLKEYLFLRVHTSFVVNKRAVQSIVKNGIKFELLLNNGEIIPISRRRKIEVNAWLIQN